MSTPNGMTGTAEIAVNQDAYFDRMLLETTVPLLLHNMWAQKRDIPRNAGTKQIRFRRYELLNVDTNPLSEGVTPEAEKLTHTDITAEAKQYGKLVVLTDVADYTRVERMEEITKKLLGQNAGQTLDSLTRDVLVTGTNEQFGWTSNAHTSRSQITATEKFRVEEAREIVRFLKENNVPMMTEMVPPSTGVGTIPIEPAYIGIVGPRVEHDIRGDSAFVSSEKYGHQTRLLPGEFGKIDQIRLVSSTNAKVWTAAGASGQDIHSVLVFGQDAYGTTSIGGESLKHIREGFGSAGTEDGLHQRASAAWKAEHVAEILDEVRMFRLDVSVS